MTLTQFPASLSITNLNGQNGFTVIGSSSSESGSSVSKIGDINGDGIVDLLISAAGANNGAGESYVVFGKSELANGGTLSATSLTGSNGFVIVGFSASYNNWVVGGVGDINNDGIADFSISTPGTCCLTITPCKTYILFGKVGIGGTGVFDVSHLTGSNGFMIVGPVNSQNDLIYGNSAGDINHDGINDLVIGFPGPGGNGPNGLVYVVFGKSSIGNSGILNLSNLNSVNGFNITGFPPNQIDAGGLFPPYSSGVGDINADGIDDLLVSSLYAGGIYGTDVLSSNYVIFGNPVIGSMGTINVTSLTGINGFVFSGVQCSVQNSWLSCYGFGVGDVNDDGIVDLSLASGSYVVFGKSKIGSSGIFSLTNLNGNNGFKVLSPLTATSSITAIYSAGDVNDDGIDDLITESKGPQMPSSNGAGYVIFGKKGLGSTGILDLTNLIGTNGFTVPGFPFSGSSVSGIGDINDDGVDDLVIGASGAFSGDGACYVIFGDTPANLLTNSMVIERGHTVIINNVNLNATSLKFPSRNGGLIFSIYNSLHSQFTEINNPGAAITSFTQQQIWNSQIQFSHDGSVFAPSYSVSIGDGGFAGLYPPQPASITFIHLGPRLVNNNLAISQGQTIILTTNQLGAVDQDYPLNDPNLIFIINSIMHGQFEVVINPGIATTNFIQAQVQTGYLQFVHDGSINPPSYSVQVSDGIGGITTSPQMALINFNLPPVLVNNSFIFNQGQVTILSGINLSATDPDDSASGLIFMASNVQFGHFEIIEDPGIGVLSFTQAQIDGDAVKFIPSGSINPPSFNMSVSDGKVATQPQISYIVFNLAPQLINNELSIDQGESVILSSTNLSATDPDGIADSLMFIVSQVQYGRFELVANPGMAVNRFSQAQVNSGAIQFTQDGSNHTPSYSISLSDGKITTPAQISLITFNASPVLINNQLSIIQGQTVTITPADLTASDDHTPAGELVFTASGVVHGHFEDSSHLGIATTQFTQQRIFNGALKFIADGSIHPPAYNISVNDGSLSTVSTPAIINFSLNMVVAAVSTNSNTVRNAIIGGAVSGVMGLMLLALKLTISYRVNRQLNKALEESGRNKFIRPIAIKIFDRIRTTGFFGYRSEKQTKNFITAIEQVVRHLVDSGVDLNVSLEKQTRIFNEIARQTKHILVAEHSYCSIGYLCSFFKPETTSKQISINATDIANAVVLALKKGKKKSSSGVLGSSSRKDVHEIELAELKNEDNSIKKEILGLKQNREIMDQQLLAVDKRLEKINIEFKKILISKADERSDEVCDLSRQLQ